MSKKNDTARKLTAGAKRRWVLPVLAAAFFLLTLLVTPTPIKIISCLMMVAAVVCIFIRHSVFMERLTIPFAALFLWTLVCGISTLYASSGKFALYEYLKLLIAFCFLVLVLCFERKGVSAGRGTALILECACALLALFSIDLLSTRLLSTPLLGFLGWFSTDFLGAAGGVEEGVRMTSILINPNVFAGVVGLGVLLSLGLVNSTEPGRRGERRFHLSCLFLNALGFVLAFSMGASGTIVLAFLVMIALETRARRMPLVVLMVETLVLTVLAAFPIFLTSFRVWDGFQPIPLLCAVLGAALLCMVDQFAGEKVGVLLSGHGKASLVALLVLVAALGGFAALALNTTGSATLEAGAVLRRAAYPAPGDYTLQTAGEGAVDVTIESQNRNDTMMHTSTVLYAGAAEGASYAVPEDSVVVYFNFSTPAGARLDAASYTGAETGALPLGYKLLPGFIANRLQGLFANQNAIQRLVFFEDGMKLFLRNPVFGLGMGAYESAITSVQSFYYETKYAHNHYVQMLVETGVVGLAVFVGVLVLSAAALLKSRKRAEHSPLLAALGAALVFMAGHAATEVVFSNCHYLLFALGVFALICVCCGDALPFPAQEKLRTGGLFAVAGWLVVYLALLGGNLYAGNMINRPGSHGYGDLQSAIFYDRFEWADYMLSYVYSARGETDPNILAQAAKYAERLERVNSNTIPLFLSEYYFTIGDEARGFDMLYKYVDYTASDPQSWQSAFLMAREYYVEDETFHAGVLELSQKLQDRNASSMGQIALTDEDIAFIARVEQAS